MTTETEARIDEIMTAIEDTAVEIMREDLANGANDYAWVRVAPDGSVYSGRSVSRECGEDEYYSRVPHPLTAWDARGLRPSADPCDGVFAWKATRDGAYVGNDRDARYRCVDQISEEELADLTGQGWYRFDLDTDDLVEPLTIDDTLRSEIRQSVEAWAAKNLLATTEE